MTIEEWNSFLNNRDFRSRNVWACITTEVLYFYNSHTYIFFFLFKFNLFIFMLSWSSFFINVSKKNFFYFIFILLISLLFD